MGQRENPVRTYLPSDLKQWVSEMAARKRCSVSHVLRDIVALAKNADTLQAHAITDNHPVLTGQGWKPCSDLEDGELIAVWNPETKMVELHPVQFNRVVPN